MPDLIITGVPRSGTSLAAALIDQAPDSLCLSEPEHHEQLMRSAADADDFIVRIGQEFAAVRRSLLAGEGVLDRRHADGAAVTNYFGDPGPDGQRLMTLGFHRVTRLDLSANFWLAIKHNALYAAVLPEIARSGRFRVVATVRDPVSVLTSWRSVNLPIARGRLPAAERFWPEMAALTRAAMDLTEKQIRICDLLCRRFARLADRIAVIRYETFAADPTRLLVAAGLPAASPYRSVPLAPRPYADRDENGARAAIASQIRQLMVDRQLPGLARYYPEYEARRPPAG